MVGILYVDPHISHEAVRYPTKMAANGMEEDFDDGEQPEITTISDPHLRMGISARWGAGNQLAVHAALHPPQEGVTSGIRESPRVHEVRWGTQEVNNPIIRKLINETHGTFVALQHHQPDTTSTTSNRKPQLSNFSRKYRSVIRACLMQLKQAEEAARDDVTAEEYGLQVEIYSMVELIWSLCEILFVESLPGGVVLAQLLDWVKWHFNEADGYAREATTSDTPHLHDSYWSAIYLYVLQGRGDEARKLLSLDPTRSMDVYDEYASIDELLRKMPFFTLYTGQSLAEFDMKWRHWQDECRRRYSEGEFNTNKNLETICRILCGDEDVFLELKDLTETWYRMLVSKLLYCNPTVKAFDLQYHVKACIDAYDGHATLGPLDNILLAAIEFDLHQVIKESSSLLGNWWFVAHLADLLFQCGQLESHSLNYGSNLREFLLLDYASSLMSHPSLWQVGASYLDYCPEFGRYYLEFYLERLPLQTEQKALKVLRECEKRDMKDISHSICKVMGVRALRNERLGSALSWALRSKDASFATFLADRFLSEYSSKGGFSSLDLLDNLGTAMVLSDRLTFLGKYREFHRLHEEWEFKSAANLLLQLLTNRMAPKKFWLTLLTDALPLLESEEVIFSTQQTYELMNCLEDISLSFRSSAYLHGDQPGDAQLKPTKGQQEVEKQKLDLIRLALARNLARAILSEGSLE
ncbi:nuclear pore complex protein Nup85-like [Branchiostoma floridae]|uniref:Nuclear pore complex protein Nup85 n=1 Tax=Branchiostoma floridae TaxID=7739 RepID=A0A9J7N6S2_BRAFL|nr:nuclear pore complex protein Nup85-like [Branchiostoma floridae]